MPFRGRPAARPDRAAVGGADGGAAGPAAGRRQAQVSLRRGGALQIRPAGAHALHRPALPRARAWTRHLAVAEEARPEKAGVTRRVTRRCPLPLRRRDLLFAEGGAEFVSLTVV